VHEGAKAPVTLGLLSHCLQQAAVGIVGVVWAGGRVVVVNVQEG
jgi:hypothetical protein